MKTLKCKLTLSGSNVVNIFLSSFNKNLLIPTAKIKLLLRANNNADIIVSYSAFKANEKISEWDNVNTLSNVDPNSIYSLDVTDEIRDAMDRMADKISLTFNGAGEIAFPNAELEQNVEFECVLKEDYQANASIHTLDLGHAGSGEINLATGELSLNHADVSSNLALPVNLAHTFNSNNGEREDLNANHSVLTKTHVGKGFKLNLQQHLVKEKTEDGSLQFTYIDAQGRNHYFNEKYHYLDENNNKIDVKWEDLKVAPDGILYTEVDGIKHKIETTLETDTGLKLVSSIAGLNGSDLVDYEPEELANVRQALKSLEENKKKYVIALEDLKYQYVLNQLENLNNENHSKTANIYKGIKYKNFSDKLNKYLKSNKLELKPETIFSENHFNSLLQYLLNNSIVYWQPKLNEKNQEDGTLTRTFSCEYLGKKQTENLVENICQYYEALQRIDGQISKYEYQLKQLEMQLPVYYLYNDEQTVYGFGKTYEENEENQTMPMPDDVAGEDEQTTPPIEISMEKKGQKESAVYRLILITDPYENTVFVAYDEIDSSKIAGVVDGENNEVLFNYNEQDLLSNIVDCKDRKIEFDYNEENQLVKITHPNGEVVRYFYKDNQLTHVLDESTGLGAKFEYENGKVSKISTISVLNCVENGQIKFNFDYDGESATTQTLLNFEEQKGFLVKDETISFNYYDYKSTTITDAHGNKQTYVLDRYGKTMCVYENVFDENNPQNTAKAMQYAYTNNKISESISSLPYSANYLNNVCFDASTMQTECAFYLGEDVFLGGETIAYTYQVCKHHTMQGKNEAATACLNVKEEQIAEIKANNIPSLVLSCWAKADSAFVFDAEERTTENEEYNDSTEEIKSRKFDLRAELTYLEADGHTSTETFAKTFDWMNTQWQYCALPIKVSKTKTLQAIASFVDYTFNTGEIMFTDLELHEGQWAKTEYANKQPIKTYSSHSEVVTTYEYENEKLIKEIATLNGKEYITTYEYNKNGKLLRKVDHNGIVTENVFNNKGMCIKTKTYHKADPTTVFYSETELDEKGNETGDINELGEKVSTYEHDTAGLLTTQTDSQGNKTAYGYNLADNLISISHSVNTETNSNIFGYTSAYLTSLKHNGFEIAYNYDCQGRTNEVKIADSTYLTKTYGEQEEITTFANGETFKQLLDKNGKLWKMEYNGTTEIENVYDTHGNLIKTTDKSNDQEIVNEYSYNKFGNVKKAISNPHSVEMSIATEYDEHQNVTSSTISIGEKALNYIYNYSDDLDKNLNLIELPNGKTQTIKTDKLGRTTEVALNNLTKQYNYLQVGDHASNLVSSEWFGKDGVISENLKYKYDENGNIVEIRENGNFVARYTYDSLSRLTREDNKKLGKTYVYEYDCGGNILSKKGFNFTLNSVEELESIKEYNYCYNSTRWKDQLVSFNGETFVYDQLGNPTTYRGETLTWSHGRQLDVFDTHTFKYNANGIRVQKDDIKYFLNGNKIIAQQDNENTMYFHYGADGVVGFELNGAEYTYKKNIQGDIIGIYDSESKLICKYIYDAWGNHRTLILYKNASNIEEYVDINDVSKYNINVDYVSIAKLNPFRYRSYYFDIETRLYYLNSRYYDPQIGRFINSDDISILNQLQEELNGINLYVYCFNNPVNDIDENGNWSWKKFWSIIAVVAAVAVISVATMGIGAAITSVMGGGLAASVIGGAIGGAITGSLTSFASSVLYQGINNGFSNIDWKSVGISSLIGGVTGAVLGGITGAVKYFSSTTKLYRSMSESEYNSLKSTGKFSAKYGQMEGKFFATSKQNALTWGSKLGSSKIAGVRVLKSALKDSSIEFFKYNLDGIGKAYYFSNIEYLNSIIRNLFF